MVTRCCRPLAAWHRHRSWRMCIRGRSRCTRWRRVCPLKLHTQDSAFRVIVEPEVHVSGSVRGHPLTIPDDHSRYALGLAACPNQRTATVRAHLISAFQRYGLPDRLLVGNGGPWGNHPAHPYTPLTVWLRRLGIAVSHSRPYHPQTLGKDERFHGTLQRDLARQPLRPDLAAWQTAFDGWRYEYNHVRPHASLALAVPASRYQGQPQALPSATAAAALRARRSTATSSDGPAGCPSGAANSGSQRLCAANRSRFARRLRTAAGRSGS